jgi:hypothetical protein
MWPLLRHDRIVPGLLGRLFTRSSPTPVAVEPTVYPGGETLEVVGESNYQEALWEIVGGFRSDPVRHPVHAVLLPEPDNCYDPNAIKVVVDRRLVGYLSREDAAAYLPGLRHLMASAGNGHVALAGQIVGGGQRGQGIGFLGVFLDHSPSDFGVAPHHTSGGTLRTGLGQAIATDLDDDSYDLSWLNALPAADEAAASALGILLAAEQDPIDRHYMYCELEARLYRARKARPSALDEFDEICALHHEEMATLRPALLAKFGAVPVIELYRQASIRCQKSREWEAAYEWAQRGLEVYGEQAARREAVEDLEKRLAHAMSRIEEAARPKVSPQRTVFVAAKTRHPTVETLVCMSCGASFERDRVRGRKPKSCPTCRA